VNSQYDILIRKLDDFIRKYYKNLLIKGGLYFLGIATIFFILVNLIEYFGRFNSTIRTVIFYIYILINVFILIRYILIPFIKLLRIGKIISHEQAARIIGDHFKEVQDRLLNTLQLKILADNTKDNLLIYAGIDQKINDLKPLKFNKAIDLRKNKRYIKYAALPLVIVLLIIIGSPSLITEPSTRLINHQHHFDKVLPFKIEILNNSFEVLQNENFRVMVQISGSEIPEELFIKTDNIRNRMQKENNTFHLFTFHNVQKNTAFSIETDNYQSDNFEIIVLPKPVLLEFEVLCNYPGYTGKKAEVFSNNGDLIVPEGTEIQWKFTTKNTDQISFKLSENENFLQKQSSDTFVFREIFHKNQLYTLTTSNSYVKRNDSLSYTITVIPDNYPSISIQEFTDSDLNNIMYFKGIVKDDYGLTKLTFNYTFKTIDGNNQGEDKIEIELKKDLNPQQYYYTFNPSEILRIEGKELFYFFEVWDNDEVNGNKSTRTQIAHYKFPGFDQMKELAEKTNEEIKKEMEEIIDESNRLQNEISKINKELHDKKELNWEDKQKINNVLEKQKQLERAIEDIKTKNEEKNLRDQQLNTLEEDIINKQKQLEELFNKLVQDETIKKLFDELQKLLDEANKDKVNELLEEMKLSTEELEKMLDRDLELFKQLEFEQKLDETIQKLKELSEQEQSLSEESLNNKMDIEKLKEKQDKINKDFDSVKKDLKDLDALNKELEDSNNFETMEEEQESVSKELENSQNELEHQQRKNASKSQKNASQQMQKMVDGFSKMQQEMVQQGMSEDIDALRDILENLIQISFDQEDLMTEVENININDPQFNQLIQSQKAIKDNLSMVEDSLYALSKRQIMIEPFVSKEIHKIEMNVEKSIAMLNERRTQQAAGNQQSVMTSINNLALMLSESLNQMNQMMMQQGSCNSSCKSGMPKPGMGSMGMKSMRQLQEQLNKQIEQLKAGMKDGDKGQGGKRSANGQSLSEQLARTAAQQESLRNELRKYADQLEKEGHFGDSKTLNQIAEEMEKSEADMVNKLITNETLLRQQEILTRLLKSEKAELEREKEEKRESIEAKNIFHRNPDELFKYNEAHKNEVELLKTLPPSFKPFYKSKVNQYFYKFEELLEK
jgi:hypothetical protein